jgi:hypothetical protein
MLKSCFDGKLLCAECRVQCVRRWVAELEEVDCRSLGGKFKGTERYLYILKK